jgi:hypothetical protein
MNLDDGGVNHGVFHVRVVGHGIKNPFKNIGLDPIAKPFENRIPMIEMRGQVAPRSPCSGNP